MKLMKFRRRKIHVIPDEKTNKNLNVTKISDLDENEPEMNKLNRLERALRKLETSYNPIPDLESAR